MPVAKIHVHQGTFDDDELSSIGLAVQAALEEVLSVPGRGLTFASRACFPRDGSSHARLRRCTYSERLVFLELTFIAGRPKDKRLALLAALNRLVVAKVSLRPDDLLVMIYELPGENISFGHGLAQLRGHRYPPRQFAAIVVRPSVNDQDCLDVPGCWMAMQHAVRSVAA